MLFILPASRLPCSFLQEGRLKGIHLRRGAGLEMHWGPNKDGSRLIKQGRLALPLLPLHLI